MTDKEKLEKLIEAIDKKRFIKKSMQKESVSEDLDLLSAHAAIKGMAVPESMKIITKEIILTKECREKLAKIINNDRSTRK